MGMQARRIGTLCAQMLEFQNQKQNRPVLLRPLVYCGMTVSMREVIGRALTLNARPLHARLATSRTCTAHVRAPMKHVAAFDSSPHSSLHVCESTRTSSCEHQQDMLRCMLEAGRRGSDTHGVQQD